MHLRAPAIAPGVKALLWALFFALYLWLGLKAIAISGATAFVLSAVAGFVIFLFVRVAGSSS